ncbi:glycosyltransferase family 4 protein [Marinobacter sp. MDS2]|uniref:glycosyltransferase family 4 protein n=1 Tax=Marinobacter sp. MDS2 TaxID=3065961 RepID=UPI00273AD081|nr:glycosyltransferase family 4 protein [Marinobacter sp. MDS2]MDP4546871.1 glycosyltransferase family 4 protein [Marinobacter sp. MDS2]
MLEPLGQSQVLSYLKFLSKNYQVSLISFEKPEDRADQQAFGSVQNDCERHGIRWFPQRFHHRPKVIAPAWSMIVFLFLCLREVREGNAELIHARSYIPAAVALLVNKLTGTPFIFDMRALWPEELITAGRLKRGSVMHKAIAWVERSCLKNAAAVVSLTDAATAYLRETYPDELRNQKLVVIPTCADLDRFVPLDEEERFSAQESAPVFSCLGTVLSGWFRLDWLRIFFQEVGSHEPTASFEIVTRDDPSEVRRQLGLAGDLNARLKIYSMPSHEVHEAVQRHTASVMFYAGGEVSELGRSPTRMAEILGCGLPVVANPGVGDVAEIIQKYRVGVLVTEGTPDAMKSAFRELLELMNDAELPGRCRRAAEKVFSLQAGTQAYRELYRDILQ